MMEADPDSDVVLSDTDQQSDEFSTLDEMVSTKRLTAITLDALPAEKYLTIKREAFRDPDSSLEQVKQTMKTTFMNHSKRLSATNNNQQSNQRCREQVGSQ